MKDTGLVTVNNQLPARLEDLTKFVLIGREKLVSVRAEIRAIDKLDLAKDVREQKMEEAQMLGGALLDAEARIGEMIKVEPKLKGRDVPGKSSVGVTLKNYGITKKQSHFFQTLADNPDIVEQVKAEATENEDIPTRTEVLRRVKEKSKEQKREDQKRETQERSNLFKTNDEKFKLYHGDFYEICKDFDDNSIDHIITDPPYPKEFLPLWGKLSEVAARVLKPGGFCIAYSGKLHLPEVINLLSTHLEYYWQLILIHKGLPAGVHPVKINTQYKPILVFYKGPVTPQNNYVTDVIQGSGREKELHEWQQGEGEIKELLDRFTSPNDLILDPFAGSGTTRSGCLSNDRRCIGVELSGEYYDTIRGRLANVI